MPSPSWLFDNDLISASKHFISSKRFAISSILFFVLGASGWKLWKHFNTPRASKNTKNRSERNFSTNSELIEHLSASREMEFDKCIKYIFENTDRRKYATDLTLSNEDLQLVRPYDDSAMPIRCNATISAPHIHVTCLNALKGVLENKEEISCLDIGSGSGFVSSAMCHMMEFYHVKKGKVLAIDHIHDLVEFGQGNVENDENSKKFLSSNSSIKLIFKTGNGYDKESIQDLYFESFIDEQQSDLPLFDVIHMGASCPNIPQHLYKLLKPNGRIVCPVGPPVGIQELFCIEKLFKKSTTSENDTREIQIVQSIGKVHFVPLFGSVEEQERHYNRSNPRVIEVNEGQQFVVLPYLHLVDNSITSFEDIKWEGE